jgi:hypothetical protein
VGDNEGREREIHVTSIMKELLFENKIRIELVEYMICMTYGNVDKHFLAHLSPFGTYGNGSVSPSSLLDALLNPCLCLAFATQAMLCHAWKSK